MIFTRRLTGSLLVLTLPVLAVPMLFALMPDLTEANVRGRSDLNYLVEPPQLTDGARWLVLAASLVASVTCTVALLGILRSATTRQFSIVIPTFAWVLAAGWAMLARILMVGSSGASMGGLALPLIVVLAVLQLLLVARVVRRLNPR